MVTAINTSYAFFIIDTQESALIFWKEITDTFVYHGIEYTKDAFTAYLEEHKEEFDYVCIL